jgi:uncharacterized protein YggE
MLRLAIALALLLPATALAEAPPRTLTVSAEGETRVVPDEVFVTVSVHTEGKTASQALAQNDERTKATLALAREKFGIAPEHLQTGQLSLGQRYSNDREPKLVGYEANREVVLCLLDLPRFEALLSALVEAGVNGIPGFQLTSTRLPAQREAARLAAVRAAKEKAAAMAKELGQKLGRPLEVSESASYNESARSYTPSHGGSASAGAFSPGELVITAAVTARFELVD